MELCWKSRVYSHLASELNCTIFRRLKHQICDVNTSGMTIRFQKHLDSSWLSHLKFHTVTLVCFTPLLARRHGTWNSLLSREGVATHALSKFKYFRFRSSTTTNRRKGVKRFEAIVGVARYDGFALGRVCTVLAGHQKARGLRAKTWHRTVH